MDLKIEIPVHYHNSSPKYDGFNPPPAPKVGISRKNHHFFDWEISDINFESSLDTLDSQEIDNLYEEAEEFIYVIDHSKDKRSYKSNFQDKIRILIKKVSVNNDIKRLYILIKDCDLWFRSYIDLLYTEEESKYYDIQWK